jgi:hypothetical protein
MRQIITSWFLLPNVKSEPRAWLAQFVLLGARNVTAMLVGSTALLGSFLFEDQRDTEPLDWIRIGSSWTGIYSLRAPSARLNLICVGSDLAPLFLVRYYEDKSPSPYDVTSFSEGNTSLI